jgi:hypothetical protein
MHLTRAESEAVKWVPPSSIALLHVVRDADPREMLTASGDLRARDPRLSKHFTHLYTY